MSYIMGIIRHCGSIASAILWAAMLILIVPVIWVLNYISYGAKDATEHCKELVIDLWYDQI